MHMALAQHTQPFPCATSPAGAGGTLPSPPHTQRPQAKQRVHRWGGPCTGMLGTQSSQLGCWLFQISHMSMERARHGRALLSEQHACGGVGDGMGKNVNHLAGRFALQVHLQRCCCLKQLPQTDCMAHACTFNVQQVADLGLSRRLLPGVGPDLTGETGTYLYMSPEVMR